MALSPYDFLKAPVNQAPSAAEAYGNPFKNIKVDTSKMTLKHIGERRNDPNWRPADPERQETSHLLPAYATSGKEYLENFEKTGSDWLESVKSDEEQYQQGLQGLMKEAEAMGARADAVYTDVSGRQKAIMDRAKGEADSAMTLAEASDPNNKVAKSFRDFYEQKAQGARQAGMADIGVMQALGAQAFGGQMGAGGPMTGGQIAALAGQNQSQAGMAMANVQRRVQDLRDQGIAEGWAQTDKAYNRGLEARDFYQGSVGDYQDTHNQYQTLAAALRGERGRYGEGLRSSRSYVTDSARNYGLDLASVRHGIKTQDLDKIAAMIQTSYDRQAAREGLYSEERSARQAANAAATAGEQQMLGYLGGGMMAGMMAASDIRSKKDITRVKDEDVIEFMERVNPVMFRYISEDSDSSEHIGLIAQDIKDTELGKRIVHDNDGLLMIRKDELVGALLACMSLVIKRGFYAA